MASKEPAPRGRQAASPAEDLNQDFEIDQNDLYLAILGRLHGENGLPPIDLDQTGVLEGQVLEDVGDAAVVIPVPEAEVFILASTGHRFRIRTNERGTFRADGIPAGPVSVRVKHPNYHPGYARAEVRVDEPEEVTIHLMPRRPHAAVGEELAVWERTARAAIPDEVACYGQGQRHTHCADCGRVLIWRYGGRSRIDGIDRAGGCCQACGTLAPIRL